MTSTLPTQAVVTFPLLSSEMRMVGGTVTVYRRPDALDVVKLVVRIEQAVLVPDGTPVNVSWGPLGQSSSVLGYVVSRRTVPGGSKGERKAKPDIELTIFGAGTVLKAANGFAWQHTSASLAISELLAQHRLSAMFWVRTDPVLQGLHQGTRSDLKLLVDTVTDLGWCMAWDGTTVMVTDRSDPLQRLRLGEAWVAELEIRESPEIRKAKMLKTRQVFGVVDQRTASVVWQHPALSSMSWTTEEAPWHRIGSSVGADLDETQAKADAIEASDRWTQTMTATVTGDPRYAPGQIVAVRGNAYSEADGLWFVESATHRMRADRPYLTDLTLGRDSSDWIYGAVPQRRMAPVPPVRMLAGKWVSSWAA